MIRAPLVGLAVAMSCMHMADAQTIQAHVSLRDKSALLAAQPAVSFETPKEQRRARIVVDANETYQEMEGFGFALTWGSAQQLHRMSHQARARLLRRIFVEDGVSYLRLSVGASDLNSFVYSYDDMPNGRTDPKLERFSLGHDRDHVLPMLKEILAIAPDVTIMASPWSAPLWMKTRLSAKGASLSPEHYGTYARYLVRYVEAMRDEGVKVHALTVQNEPLNSGNTPSMPMRWEEQARFIGEFLGPALRRAGLDTRIMAFDHNTDRPDYPLAVLSDEAASKYVDGSAFHNYRGDISAMSQVHAARPDKNVYFTEQMVVEQPGQSTIDVVAPVKRIIIGATRNWSRNVILWNLAADRNNDPHTDDGGCSICQGALTIDGDQVGTNLAYYALAHASRFVPRGSRRIASTSPDDRALLLTRDEGDETIARATMAARSGVAPNVAFRTPSNKVVLIVANDGSTGGPIEVQYRGRAATLPLPAGAVGTYVWDM